MKKRVVKSLVAAMGLCVAISTCACSSKTAGAELTEIEETVSPLADSIEQTETEEVTVAVSVAEEEEVASQVVLEYPSHMQEMGYTESLVFESIPQRIVSLTTYPVQALFEMDVMPIALPSTKVMKYPDSFTGEVLPGIMTNEFDVEKIVAMEPDLVFMPSATKDSYGVALEQLGIPVYYVAMNATGKTSYEVVKEQTQAIVNAFAIDSDRKAKAENVMSRFADLEKKVDAFAKNTQGKSVFAITVSGTSIYINGADNTLGSMLAMLGYENVYSNQGTGGHGMNELDMEVAIEYTPDVCVITGSSTLEDNKAMMDAIYESNPEYWDTIPAYKEGKVVYLPSSYVSTAGMNILDNIENLMSDMEGLN